SIVKVAKNLQLITTDLVAEGRITTPSLLFGIGTGEKVKVKARQWGRGRPSDPTTVVEVGVRWSQTVRTAGGTGKFQKTRPSHSVRAVHCRSARLQNFDALNRRHRDGIDIDKGASEHSSNTASIQQNQAGSWIQSAQRHRSKPDRATLARAVVGDRNTV